MKKITTYLSTLLVCFLITGFSAMAQTTAATNSKNSNTSDMKTYVIERNIPGAGQFSPEKLKDISKTSCTVLKEMGPDIQWVHSYVTDGKIFCIYKAKSIELLKEHAKRGGFPIDAVYEVENVISPATAN